MEFSEVELTNRIDVPGAGRALVVKGNRFQRKDGYDIAVTGFLGSVRWRNAEGKAGAPVLFPFSAMTRGVLAGELASDVRLTPLASVLLPRPIRDVLTRASSLGTRSHFTAAEYSLHLAEPPSGAPFVVIQCGNSPRLVVPIEQVQYVTLAGASAKARKTAA